MARLRAVVLAAGRGVRMGGHTPKTLIPVDDGEPLLHYILAGLKRAGIEDLMVVTGFKPKELQDFTTERWNGSEPRFVFNARYASWGNFHSLRVALDQSPGMDVLVVNCDIVVHPDVVTRVMAVDGDLVIAVERRQRLDEEDMRVQLAGDRVLGIGKDLKMPRSHGEFAGVSLVRPEASRAYLNRATGLEWQADTMGYYEDVYARILDDITCRAAFVEPGEYAEVDEPTDLEAAKETIERHRTSWEEAPAVAQEPA